MLLQNSTLKLVTIHGAVVQSKSFTLFIMLVVLINAILLSLNRHVVILSATCLPRTILLQY